jgi:hypothetical protein
MWHHIYTLIDMATIKNGKLVAQDLSIEQVRQHGIKTELSQGGREGVPQVPNSRRPPRSLCPSGHLGAEELTRGGVVWWL